MSSTSAPTTASTGEYLLDNRSLIDAAPVRRSARLTTIAEFTLLMALAFVAGVILAGFALPGVPR